jgi:NAD(P)-dependent dehydrogenase (short-subunit alcohol dehydrogenase family)
VSLIGHRVAAVQGDVSNLADLDRLFAKVAREKGKIDVLFAGAGIVDPQPLSRRPKKGSTRSLRSTRAAWPSRSRRPCRF